MKQCKSWYKPDDIKNLLGIKRVDPTILREYSTVIPQIFQEEFPSIEKLRSRGHKKMTVSLKYAGQMHEGYIAQDPSNRIKIGVTSSELKQIIRNTFTKSVGIFLNQNDISNELSDSQDNAEYIEFYSTDREDTYEIKLSAANEWDDVITYNKGIDIEWICMYFNKRGFTYNDNDICNFYLSLKSKPFVILSGISGTGKSKLVRLFAEAIDAKFELIPVRPDWSDATELLGYKDINQNFQVGKLTQIMIEASNNPDKPYIVCLDEMNLARVEYYFSDFLSLIESRHWDGKTIVTDQLANESIALNKSLSIPDNLYIIGTVNMDETTLQFSNKVLDRANTIELNEVDLTYNFEDEVEIETEAASMPLHNRALKSKYLILRDCKAYAALADRVIKQLIVINDILKIAQMQFAYRVRDEIIFYMAYNEEYDLMREKEAFDYQLLQKILPRINGTSARLYEMLKKLLAYCIGEEITEDSYNLEDLAKKVAIGQYPKSGAKLLDMLRRYDEDGFTSFWS